MSDPRVLRVKGHMCAQGMVSRDLEGEGLVLKPTGYLTSSPEIADEVSAKCTNRDGEFAIESQFDFHVQHFVMPKKIQWQTVTRRLSYNAQTGELLQDLKQPQTCSERELFGKVPGSVRVLHTVLLQVRRYSLASSRAFGRRQSSGGTNLPSRFGR